MISWASTSFTEFSNRKISEKERYERGQTAPRNRISVYKRVTDVSNLRYSVHSLCTLLEKISTIPIPFSHLSKIISTKMKISHATPMSLFAASTLVCQALSAPYGNSAPDTRLTKRAQRVAYAGINIAGCDFGIDTNVSKQDSTLDVSRC